MDQKPFILHSIYQPSGDQIEAISKIVINLNKGVTHQTLKGVTGSGKTFTMANVIHQLNRPTLILAHNKTLVFQLYQEMKHFFPDNAVEYFVSYYDYYQPEIYLPRDNRFIRKDSVVNEQLERMRLSTTKSLIERRDVIVVASVSSIYGLGDPHLYKSLQIYLKVGENIQINDLIKRLEHIQYSKTTKVIERSTYSINNNVIEIFPSDSQVSTVKVEIQNNKISKIYYYDTTNQQIEKELTKYCISPKTLYYTPPERLKEVREQIINEMNLRIDELNNELRFNEATRIYERTMHDLEMMAAQGYCGGMENYSCYLTGRSKSLPPTTLLNYLPKDALLFIDESHVMVPQISMMYKSDLARKENLINYGFRLPSSKHNRPLNFEEFEQIKPQTIFVSATPGKYEIQKSKKHIAEQLIRPTGLLDPEIEIRDQAIFDIDIILEIHNRIDNNSQVIITTTTKKRSEELNIYLNKNNIKSEYIHSELIPDKRNKIIKKLKEGDLDVVIGIGLLREGIDIPNVSLVIIEDADKTGFLRSTQALIQIIGRAARNINGKAILYAKHTTPAMQLAIEETSRRRVIQQQYNIENNITSLGYSFKSKNNLKTFKYPNAEELTKFSKNIHQLEKALIKHIENKEDKEAKFIRKQIISVYKDIFRTEE